jgi:regulator of RNase E activity RraA
VSTLADRFELIYVPAILDVMEERGLRNQALPPGLLPVSPDQKVAGPAFPYRFKAYESWDRDEILPPILEAYQSAPEGSVLVADAGVEPPYAAHFGELSAATCKKEGLRGAIINGGLRDGAYVASTGFPVWYRYRTPIDVVGRYRIERVGEQVELGGVTIALGDYIVADLDGVVVVPAGIAEEIAAAAEACVSEERAIRERIAAGERATKLFAEMGRF